MFETIKTNHGRLDVCVNNAGLAHQAPILSGETWQWRNMLDVSMMFTGVDPCWGGGVGGLPPGLKGGGESIKYRSAPPPPKKK